MTDTPDPIAQFRLDGAVVLLTGATGGLGTRFAEALNAAGARLVLSGRNEGALHALASRLDDATIVRADMADPQSVDALVAGALGWAGRVDVLVNNAGTAGAVPALDEPMDTVRDMLEVDLVAPYRLCQLVARSVRERGATGSIVNIASFAGTVGNGRLPVAGYAAAKAGVIGLTRELAAQWGRFGIRVNALSPGWFDAGMASWVREDPKAFEWVTRQTPLRRLGVPSDLDGPLLFLASQASRFVTGQVLTVDGGWTAI
jgi:NAD(P)-dependent dehydrogenase (short-subunit alcohol dehydrogenase family)